MRKTLSEILGIEKKNVLTAYFWDIIGVFSKEFGNFRIILVVVPKNRALGLKISCVSEILVNKFAKNTIIKS